MITATARRRAARRIRRLVVDTGADLRGRDIPLAAAGLTFYATVALVPLLLVALWLASLVLGPGEIRHLGESFASIVGTRHRLDAGVRQLTATSRRRRYRH